MTTTMMITTLTMTMTMIWLKMGSGEIGELFFQKLVTLSHTRSSLVQGVRQPSTPCCCCCCLLALNCCCSNPSGCRAFDPNNDENPGSGALAASTVEVRTAKTREGKSRRRGQVISPSSDGTLFFSKVKTS